MWTGLIIGILGSAGHCTGMCSALVLMLGRQHPTRSLLWAHLGRLTTYALLGLLAGSLGQMLSDSIPAWPWLQGGLSLLFAGLAFYVALTFLGRVPPLETFLAGWARSWGRTFRQVKALPAQSLHPGVQLFLTGMLWGLLPCGMVLSALLLAVAQPATWQSGLFMVLFGLGTLPGLLLVSWSAEKLRTPQKERSPVTATWPRLGAALLMALAGVQFILRGLAAWGIVNHLMLSPLMLW